MNLHRTISILTLACSLSLLRAHAADAPPRFTAPDAPRRLIYNDDGHGVFYGGQAHDAASLRKGPLALRDTHVGIFQWCVTLGTKVNYPSKIAELVGEGMTPAQLAAVRTGDRVVISKLAQLRDEGTDTLATIAEGCRAAGLRCFASIRMNPVYPVIADGWEGESMARMFNSRFWWEHPELRVIKRTGTPHLALSYAFPQVRERVLAIVREVLERDIDGIDLDFLRHPPFVGHEEAVVAAYRASTGLDAFAVPENDPAWLRFRAQHMTQLVREIRRELDAAAVRKGRLFGLSARLDHERHLLWGCDLDVWLKEDLLDILVVSRHGLGGWEFDLRPFVEKARGTHCKVFLGEEATIAGRDPKPSDEVKGKIAKPTATHMTEAMWIERARQWYAQGASGIHIFNSAPQSVLKTLDAP